MRNNDNIKGFTLALTTAVMWGLLPLALKSVLVLMDAYTITWFRFIFAAFFVGILLTSKRKLPTSILQSKKLAKRLAAAAIFLSLNYIMYLTALYYVPAETAQMLIQMAPFFMMLGGVFFLKESFSRGQMFGSVVLIVGLIMFFNQQFVSQSTLASSDFIYGVIIMFGAAITWATYAILQKKMLAHYSSNQVMWCIYLLATFFFLPLATPSQVMSLTSTSILLLFFCCANTLIAYGTFAKSLAYLPTARVSAILAITPLLTVAFANMAEIFWPNHFQAQHLNNLAYLGGCLVVIGSMLTALGNRILNKKNIYAIKQKLVQNKN